MPQRPQEPSPPLPPTLIFKNPDKLLPCFLFLYVNTKFPTFFPLIQNHIQNRARKPPSLDRINTTYQTRKQSGEKKNNPTSSKCKKIKIKLEHPHKTHALHRNALTDSARNSKQSTASGRKNAAAPTPLSPPSSLRSPAIFRRSAAAGQRGSSGRAGGPPFP